MARLQPHISRKPYPELRENSSANTIRVMKFEPSPSAESKPSHPPDPPILIVSESTLISSSLKLPSLQLLVEVEQPVGVV